MRNRKHKNNLGKRDLYSLTRRVVKKAFYFHYGLQPCQGRELNLALEIDSKDRSKKKNYCGVNIFGDVKSNQKAKETLVQ